MYDFKDLITYSVGDGESEIEHTEIKSRNDSNVGRGKALVTISAIILL